MPYTNKTFFPNVLIAYKGIKISINNAQKKTNKQKKKKKKKKKKNLFCTVYDARTSFSRLQPLVYSLITNTKIHPQSDVWKKARVNYKTHKNSLDKHANKSVACFVIYSYLSSS